MKEIQIKQIDPMLAKKICRNISSTLPEWFSIPEANVRYELGMLERLSFAAQILDEYVGMITLEFPYPNNAHIFWLAVKKTHHRKKIGKKLLRFAENYSLEHGYSSLTVETISLKHKDEQYLQTYYFYENSGFKPLFEMHAYDHHKLMIMHKLLNFKLFNFIDLTHTLTPEIPHWGDGCGFQHKIDLDYFQFNSDVKFRTQSIQMPAGIGTHIDAPAHCFPDSTTIAEIPIQTLIVPCRMIDVSQKAHPEYQLTINDIETFEYENGHIAEGSFVIIYTGWEKRWDQPKEYRNELIFPSVSEEAAKLLITRGIIGLGIDTLSPDCGDSEFPVHRLMLGAGKYIIENIANAKELDPVGFIIALPMKIQDATEAPIRLIGLQRK